MDKKDAKEIFRIAIDGPGGAGKSTISKAVARELGFEYIDTGAMYRAIALKTISKGIDKSDEAAVSDMVAGTEIEFRGGRIYLDGEDVSSEIRSESVSMAASDVSKLPAVRRKLVDLQREMARKTSVVMDGRDIGTNVIKDAEFKIYLTADPMVRAKRRYLQLKQQGREADIDRIAEDIRARDEQDMNREIDPLRQAEDAIKLDTSDMTIEDIVGYIIGEVSERRRQ